MPTATAPGIPSIPSHRNTTATWWPAGASAPNGNWWRVSNRISQRPPRCRAPSTRTESASLLTGSSGSWSVREKSASSARLRRPVCAVPVKDTTDSRRTAAASTAASSSTSTSTTTPSSSTTVPQDWSSTKSGRCAPGRLRPLLATDPARSSPSRRTSSSAPARAISPILKTVAGSSPVAITRRRISDPSPSTNSAVLSDWSSTRRTCCATGPGWYPSAALRDPSQEPPQDCSNDPPSAVLAIWPGNWSPEKERTRNSRASEPDAPTVNPRRSALKILKTTEPPRPCRPTPSSEDRIPYASSPDLPTTPFLSPVTIGNRSGLRIPINWSMPTADHLPHRLFLIITNKAHQDRILLRQFLTYTQ